jgi:DNA-binding transcriptional LysR family regulator
MDIHQLRIFASVYKNRSFSRASEELLLTQPTISDHIKSLEEEFGCSLFDRMGRTIIPTKEADSLYGNALEIIEKAEALKDIVIKLKKEPSGELLIGASTIPGTYLLPHIMSAFQRKYLSISFQIFIADSREIVNKVLSHESLVGIVGSEIKHSQLAYTPLMEDELIVVASPTLIKKEVISFQDLTQMPFILRQEGSGTRSEIGRIFAERGVDLTQLNVTGIFGSTDAIKQAAISGMGVAILSRLALQYKLKHKALKEIKVSDLHMKRNFYAVTHKKRSLPAIYSIFMEHLVAETAKFS